MPTDTGENVEKLAVLAVRQMAKAIHTSHGQCAREICGNNSVIRLISVYPVLLCWWTKYFNMLTLLLNCFNSIECCRETMDATGRVISYSTTTSKILQTLHMT